LETKIRKHHNILFLFMQAVEQKIFITFIHRDGVNILSVISTANFSAIPPKKAN